MSTASRVLMLATALMVAVPLAAQQAAFDSTSPAALPLAVPAAAPVAVPAPAVGPVLQPMPFAPSARSAAVTTPTMSMAENGETSQNVALMVVGGAGLIVGAVVGGQSGTIIMVGSGILGLVGLFRYMQ